MTRLGLQALMKFKDSGIYLRNHRNPTPLDLLRHPGKELFFMTPKRPIYYELESEALSKMAIFYAQRDRQHVNDIVLERSGMLWERMESEGLIFGSRFFTQVKLTCVLILTCMLQNICHIPEASVTRELFRPNQRDKAQR
jgi:hypothetical protein